MNHSDKEIGKHDLLISVIIPIYNEEHSIQEVIKRIPNHRRYEIILVDDGSTDNSLRKAQEVKRDIKIISHEKNKGYGAAILTGIKNATGDILVTIDSDGQHYPEEIPHLIKPIINHQADIVVGSRYLGECHYKVPLHTRVGEYFIEIVLWSLFHQRIGNNQSGFKAFSKKSLKIFKDLAFTKFGLCTEMLFKAAYKNFKIIEIPITLNPRYHGKSRVQLMKLMKSIFSCIFIYGLKKMKIKRVIPKSMYRNARNLIT